MALRVVRLGSPRQQGEGLRLGTVRRPPRGVRKTEYAAQNDSTITVICGGNQ